ncbi:acetyl-CoA acetyltransferase [Parahalioglobus pacificus]|uniref:Acetyl-CoA acetyltransferase n=1 Tax=Parahalioglobus pacificus TaxID=930806 RepID=A0A918XGF1_9GAMM|nr:acetyl-CoA acetyltransferase [Halioglobus pacificus]GHD30604.1 acetyl-CoA acetyltransferase [Halioglobus pacificus]
MSNNSPVLVAVGQQVYRDKDASRSLVDALVDASEAAITDANCPGITEAIDTVVNVPFMMEAVPEMRALTTPNVASALAERVGVSAQLFTAGVGGSLPQFFVNRFADRLVKGESEVVLIAGAELLATMFHAFRTGADVSHWTQGGTQASVSLGQNSDMTLPTEGDHGLFEPINVYPLFESAIRHHKGFTLQQQQSVLGSMVSRFSEVAANNPYAWRQQALTPEQALSTDDGNRMVVYPYTKAMNAILQVDQSAAVIMTTAGKARELGIDPSQMVYLRGGAEARDAEYVTGRVNYYSSPALERLMPQALAMAGLSVDDMHHFDLYSCFPSAVEVACDALGIAVDDPRGLTLTGGLFQFGGPGNNYSMHGIAEMVARLRESGEGHGLVNANGGYITKHAVGVYSTEPGAWDLSRRIDRQAEIDALDAPALASNPQGPGVIEAHSVRYEKGEPALGIVIGRLDSGERFLAHTDSSPEVLAQLIGEDAVGVRGQVSTGEKANRFEF